MYIGRILISNVKSFGTKFCSYFCMITWLSEYMSQLPCFGEVVCQIQNEGEGQFNVSLMT